MIQKRQSNKVDPEFIDAIFFGVTTAIALGQLYFAWKGPSTKERPNAGPQDKNHLIDSLRNIEEGLNDAIKAHNELTDIYERAERQMNVLFFEQKLRVGVVNAELDQHAMQRVATLKLKLATSAGNIGLWCTMLIQLTARIRLPNEAYLMEGLANVAPKLNTILFSDMKFREANRELHTLLEQLRRLVDGYHRSLNE